MPIVEENQMFSIGYDVVKYGCCPHLYNDSASGALRQHACLIKAEQTKFDCDVLGYLDVPLCSQGIRSLAEMRRCFERNCKNTLVCTVFLAPFVDAEFAVLRNSGLVGREILLATAYCNPRHQHWREYVKLMPHHRRVMSLAHLAARTCSMHCKPHDLDDLSLQQIAVFTGNALYIELQIDKCMWRAEFSRLTLQSSAWAVIALCRMNQPSNAKNPLHDIKDAVGSGFPLARGAIDSLSGTRRNNKEEGRAAVALRRWRKEGCLGAVPEYGIGDCVEAALENAMWRARTIIESVNVLPKRMDDLENTRWRMYTHTERVSMPTQSEDSDGSDSFGSDEGRKEGRNML